mmetsp:Transcript_15693/g.32125  ORF Transcript_15693/g.32125 Transcript_15693/m.32125 type:complete len:171 (-) Transcript_15693:197-709(-)
MIFGKSTSTILLRALVLVLYSMSVTAWEQPTRTVCDRRVALEGFATATLLPSIAAQAQPSEFKNIGTQSPLPGADDTQFTTLPNGVKIKDFSAGTGSEMVGAGSNVSVQCSGRLLNLNGVVFYNTKKQQPGWLWRYSAHNKSGKRGGNTRIGSRCCRDAEERDSTHNHPS